MYYWGGSSDRFGQVPIGTTVSKHKGLVGRERECIGYTSVI